MAGAAPGPSDVSFVDVAGRRLEYQWLGSEHGRGQPLVLLHEGLGSCSTWRDFPQQLVRACGRPALVYSRAGYGASSAAALPRTPDYMHVEALEVLPALLVALGIERPCLVGHSDGASIALIHAGHPAGSIEAVVAIAPHVFVEAITLHSIEQARQEFQAGGLRARLGRHHHDVDAAFRGWNDIWLSPSFRNWNLERDIAGLRCPLLLLQGANDPYGTLAQLDRIEASIGVPATRVVLEGAGHAPFRDAPAATVTAIADFLRRLRAA